VISVVRAGAAGAGDPAIVRNLTIADAPQPGATVTEGRSLRLEGVIIDGASQHGILVDSGADLVLSDAVIRATRPRDGLGDFGNGLYVANGSQVEVSRVVFERNRGAQLLAAHVDTLVTVRDTVLRDAESTRGGIAGGISVDEGARLEATAVLVEGGRRGIYLGGGANARLEDIVIRDVLDDLGRGLVAQGGSVIEGTRILVERSAEIGVLIRQPGTEARFTDLVVRDSSPEDLGSPIGIGITADLGAALTASRVLVERSLTIGLLADDAATTFTIEDVVVRDTASREAGSAYGRVASAHEGAVLDVSRLLGERNQRGIIGVNDGTRVSLVDAAIVDTRPMSDGDGGEGLAASTGTVLEATRLLVADVHRYAIGCDGSTATLTDVVIDRVDSLTCPDATCAEAPYEYGVFTMGGGVVEMNGFSISRARRCGILVVDTGSTLNLSAGVVSGSEIGACVQVEGFELDRLTDGVTYRDNVTNLDTTSLPVPELGALAPDPID